MVIEHLLALSPDRLLKGHTVLLEPAKEPETFRQAVIYPRPPSQKERQS